MQKAERKPALKAEEKPQQQHPEEAFLTMKEERSPEKPPVKVEDESEKKDLKKNESVKDLKQQPEQEGSKKSVVKEEPKVVEKTELKIDLGKSDVFETQQPEAAAELQKSREAKEIRIRKVASKDKGKLKNKDHGKNGKLGFIEEEEEGVVQEGSDDESSEGRSEAEKPKKKWELSEEQEKQVVEMAAQYGVEVDALKSYLETKASHNQFNWIGIKRLEHKVDVNLEIAKLEGEFE